jgi:hypothetical protein
MIMTTQEERNAEYAKLSKKFPYIVKWERNAGGGFGWAIRQLRTAEATNAPVDATYYRKGETGEHVVNGWHTVRGITNDSLLARMGIEVPTGLKTYNRIRSVISELRQAMTELIHVDDTDEFDARWSPVGQRMVDDVDYYNGVLETLEEKGFLKIVIPEDSECECYKSENEDHDGLCDRFGRVANPACECH